MSISTIEQLAGLPVGEIVRVAHPSGNQTWTKGNGEDLIREGASVKARNFIGLVEAGRVTRGGFEVGDVFLSGNSHYVVLRVDPDPDGDERRNQIHAGYIRNGQWQEIQQHAQNAFSGLRPCVGDDRPPWLPLVRQMGVALLAAQDRVAQLVRPEVRELTDEMVNSIHTIAGYADRDDLDDLLSQWGVPRTREHISDVSVTGYANYQPDPDVVSDYLDGGSSDIEIGNVPNVLVNWSASVTVTKTGTGCTCAEVTRDEVYGLLPAGVRDSQWDFEAECVG